MSLDDDFYDDEDTTDSPRPSFLDDDKSSDGSTFDSALAKLFHASREAGLPPAPLRPVLAQPFWVSTDHPGKSIQKDALARGQDFGSGGRRSKMRRALDEARVVCFVAVSSPMPDTLPAHEQLQAVHLNVDGVLLEFDGKWYGFASDQLAALEAHVRALAEKRTGEAEEARRQEFLLGAGSLDELLALPVNFAEGLPTTSGVERGKSMGTSQTRIVRVQTVGFQGAYLYRAETATLGEILTLLAPRDDYDGIEFNTAITDDKRLRSVGPNFAREVLAGIDARQESPCPAEAICEFAWASYLTRPLARVSESEREEIRQALNGARALLTAIPPDQDAFPREEARTLLGAFYLRCHPERATRPWLGRFVSRCERALKTRWRVGLF